MKKLALFFLSVMMVVSASVGAVMSGVFAAQDTGAFANSLTVKYTESAFDGATGDGSTSLNDGRVCGKSIQLKMNTTLTQGYFQKANTDSNQFTHIALYTKVKDETSYSWHTLAALNATKGSDGLSYISETTQRGDLLIIRFETMWNSKEFTPLDVKAVKLMKGMEWLIQKTDLNGDQWNNYPNGGAGTPSADTGVNEDIVLQFTKYYDGTVNDTFIPYCELGEGDTLTIGTQPAKLNYAVGDTFDASGMVLVATVNGKEQEVPVNASMVEVENVTFDSTGSKQVAVSYGGKSVSVSVTVEDVVTDHISAVSDKETYLAGESLELTVKAYASAEDTDGRTIEAGEYTVAGYDATRLGEQDVTVTYRGKTAAVKVTVAAPELTRFIDLDPEIWPYHNIGDTAEVNGVRVGYSLEIKLTVQGGDKNYLYGTDKKTNQATHVLLYTMLKGDTEYKWYTVGELTQKKDANNMPYIARIAQREATMILYFDTFYGGSAPTKEFTPLDVKAIKLKAGMQWGVQYGNKNWTDGGEGAIMPGEVGIKDDIILQIEQLYHGDASRTSCDIFSYYYEQVDSLTIKTMPDKTAYIPGETFDPAGMVLEAVKGDKTIEIASTASMLRYDASPLANGAESVEIGWGGKTVQVPVTVTPVVRRIGIATKPSKTEFALGEVLVPSFEGLVVKAYESESDTTGWTINNSELKISGYDLTVAGTQTVKVSYRDFEDTFEITVTDKNPDKKMTFYHGSPITISDQTGTLSVRFNFENIVPKTGYWSLYKTDVASNVKEKVFLKVSALYEGDKLEVGKWYSVGELMQIKDANNMPYIARASQFGESLVLHLDTYFGGEQPSLEFTNECVEAMRIEKGFYFVEYLSNNWGNEPNWDKNIESYTMLPDAIMRETVEIEKNIVGTSWLRPFKTDESGKTAADAITVKTMPTKTQYSVGDDFDPAGLVLHVKYRDGGEEDVAITDKTVCQYDFSEEGKAIVTVNFNDGAVTLEVNVGKDDQGTSSSGRGCFGMLSATSVFGFTGALLFIGALLMIFRRKKYEK